MSTEATAPVAPQVSTTAPESTSTAPSQTIDQLAQKIDAKLNPKAEGTPPPETPTPAEIKAEKKYIKSLKLKVYGQDVTEDLPFEMEDTPENVKWATTNLQMSKAAQRAMQEKGTFEKQVEAFFANLKNPAETANVLAKMGIDPVAFAAQQLEAEVKKQQLTPEQREALELKEKVKHLEAENTRKEQEYKQKQFEAKRQQISERLENEMIQALDKTDLPNTPYVAERITKYMILALQDKENPQILTPAEVLPLVRDDITREIQETFGKMSPEDFEKFVGKENFNKVRKKNIEKVKQVTPATAKAAIKEVAANQKAEKAPKEQPKVNAKEFFGF